MIDGEPESDLIPLQSYGVFLSYYLSNDTFAGATYLAYALVGGLSIGAALLLSPLATYTTARFGTRFTLLAGAILEAVSLIGASFARSTWQLFLSQVSPFPHPTLAPALVTFTAFPLTNATDV